jgi:hypothetical protein
MPPLNVGMRPSPGRHLAAWLTLFVLVMLLAGCAASAPAPQWKLRASSALDQFTQRSLLGDMRAAESEFNRATEALSRTGNPALIAQAELIRCAVRRAGLDADDCPKFRELQSYADRADQAYFQYLTLDRSVSAPLQSVEIGLLPAHHQPIARRLQQPSSGPTDDAAAAGLLRAVKDPLARLIAASVMFQSLQGGPEVIALAVETASSQGWRRPLIAWLRVQHAMAQKTGDLALLALVAERLRLAQGELQTPPR